MHDTSLGLFLTWTTYGTWLPGDDRGWSRRGRRGLPPNHLRRRFAGSRMTEDACRLTHRRRQVVAETIGDHCGVRGWPLHAGLARSNHVHVVLSAPGVAPEEVRRQLKAWTTRRLKDLDPGRSNWWSEGGDIEFLDTEAEVTAAAEYVVVAQDRKARDEPGAA